MKEQDLLESTSHLLQEIGFDRDDIFPDYQYNGKRTDLLIKQESEHFAVIEIKSQNWISSKVSSSEFPFMPVVRQAQELSKAYKTTLYGVSNGKDILWFNDGIDGKPEVVSSIKPAISSNRQNHNIEKLLFAFRSLRSYITNEFFSEVQEIACIIINAYIAKKYRDQSSTRQLYDSLSSLRIDFLNFDLVKLDQAFNLLDKYDIISYPKHALLDAVNDSFFNKRQGEYFLPRSISKLLSATILGTRNIAIVGFVDFNLAASLIELDSNSKIFAFSNIQNKYIINLIETITNKQIVYEPLNKISSYKHDGGLFDELIILPSFGVKTKVFSQRYERPLTDSTEVFIDYALNISNNGARISVLLPENFLVSERFQDIRAYILENTTIKAIISLPADTFHPYTSVKTSILVIEKRRKGTGDRAIITSIDSKSILSQTSFFKQCSLISKFLNENNDEGRLATIDSSLIDKSNFSAFNYLFQLNIEESDLTGYSLIPLTELISIRKGRMITTSKSGNIAFISQGSIKGMGIDDKAFLFTEELDKQRPPILTESEDILINSIGQYAGQAAYVGEEYSNMPISHHLFIARCKVNFVLPEYLAIILNSDLVKRQIQAKVSGSAIKYLTTSSFNKVLIPIPPLGDQDRILLKNREIKLKANNAKINLERIIKELENFINSPWKEGNI